MSSTSYSRNKYRCLLRPNHNVIVSDDNINEPKPTPQPHIYPYGYPGIYPGYGYSGYGYGYPDYGYVYPVYPGTRPFPYVVNEKKTKPKVTPKNEKTSRCEYYSSSSSSSDDEYYDEYYCHPDRYYRRHAQVSPQRVFDEQNQKPFPIPKPTPNPPIHRPRPPPPPPIPASEEIKNKKQFVKPFAKLLTKLTTPINLNDPNDSNENVISLGDSNLLEFKNEESAVDPSCNLSNMNETKIYLKV